MGNSGTPAKNKQKTHGKGYSIARVNQVSVDAIPDGADIVLGMFYVNVIPATILFDSVLHIHSCLLDMPTQMRYHC
jgi:hypothetical protein